MQQLSLFDFVQDVKPAIELSELFEAYFDCRNNKRNTLNALAFEVDYESRLLKLCAEINNGSYQPGKSIAFIVNKPVKREIFAADFRDRVMNPFDHFIKHDLGIRYYGRYVDDIILVHQNKEYLKSLIPFLKTELKNSLQLTLHPRKVYLQHYSKGVQFLGAVIKPSRIYIAKRTQGNFYSAIQKQNALVKVQKPDKKQRAAFLSSMNSYLGIMKHYKTHKLRKRMIFKNLSGWWWNRVYLSGGIAKFVLKEKPTSMKYWGNK